MSNTPTRPDNDPSRSVSPEEEGSRILDPGREDVHGTGKDLPAPVPDDLPSDVQPDEDAVGNDFA